MSNESPYSTKNSSARDGMARRKRAARAEQRGAVHDEVESHAPAIASAERLDHLLAEVSQAVDDVSHAFVAEPVELVFREGPSVQLHEEFGNLRRDGAETCPEAARENRDGPHQANTTLVPSKSKRKRTSSRPAPVIAARRRR